MTKEKLPLILAIFVAFVFLQSLFFKFAELLGEPADVTVFIFSTVGQWISSLGLQACKPRELIHCPTVEKINTVTSAGSPRSSANLKNKDCKNTKATKIARIRGSFSLVTTRS